MNRKQNNNIDDNIRLLCDISKPSFYPLNFGTINIEGTAFAGAIAVQIKIDNGDWDTAKLDRKSAKWYYQLDTRILSEGTHRLFVRLYDGSIYSAILPKKFTVRDSDFWTDIQSLKQAARWITTHAWNTNGEFLYDFPQSFPYEYVHMALGPYIVGCFNLYDITGNKFYLDWGEKGLMRLIQKQLPNGGTQDGRMRKEEPLDSACAAYCYCLGALYFKDDKKSVVSARDMAISRIKHLIETPPFKNWYPGYMSLKIREYHVNPQSTILDKIKAKMWHKFPDMYVKMETLIKREALSGLLPNMHAQAIRALAKYYDLTKNEKYWDIVIKATGEYMKWVNSDGSITYCKTRPFPYLYYMAWGTEPILEVMEIGKQNDKNTTKYENIVGLIIKYITKHIGIITSNSYRFNYDDCCKPHRMQGGGQGTTLCLWEIMSLYARYNKYFESNIYDIRPFLNYAKTLQHLDGSFPVDEEIQSQSSLWGTCCYLRNASIAYKEINRNHFDISN